MNRLDLVKSLKDENGLSMKEAKVIVERLANPILQGRPAFGRRSRGFLEFLAGFPELLVQLTEGRINVGSRDLLVNLGLKRKNCD
jgi:hypothetical protein